MFKGRNSSHYTDWYVKFYNGDRVLSQNYSNPKDRANYFRKKEVKILKIINHFRHPNEWIGDELVNIKRGDIMEQVQCLKEPMWLKAMESGKVYLNYDFKDKW